MAASGKKALFSFLTFAFFLTFLVGLGQTILQWSEPIGWLEQWKAARALDPGTIAALGLTILASLMCLAFGLFLFFRRRRLLGTLALIFAGALASAPEAPSDILMIVTASALLLVVVMLKITAVLERRKQAVSQTTVTPQPKPPTRSA